MMTIRQRARPKHQTLVLKCFPRFFKSAAEIKPNPSELSYLLYYASTRRSKLQKVGDFLEHKAAHDVRSGRTSNVQVTLQILTALIEKCPRDLPLYCQSILDILNTIFKYRDVQLVEDSVATFDAFCRHYDSAQLSADAAHVAYLEDIVRSYAAFASQSFASRTKSVPVALRYRSAALRAIKSLVSSDAFMTDTAARKMRIVMPEILDSVFAPDKPNYISMLLYRETAKEKYEKEQSARRRQSISVAKSEDTNEADPATAFGSTADADERAKEEVDLIALQSLRQICYSGRAQLRNCTREILRFVLSKTPTEQLDDADTLAAGTAVWATEVLENACRWAPVQDRFIVLIVAMETLVRSPVRESDLPRQLHLAGIIKWLLRSNINFIGLSVIDVLVGLIQRLFMLLQLHGRGALAPLQKQASQITPPSDRRTGTPNLSATNLGSSSPAVDEVVQSPSATRVRLIELFQTCIGDLATHIYYSDQVGDMVSTLLHRLRPTPSSAIPHVAAAVENPGSAADAIADSVEIKEKPHTDGFFSFDTARVCLLRAVKEVISVANSPRKDGSDPPSRNRVDISAWKNTQWLLRDPDARVRKAYVDALLAWATHEVGKSDLRVTNDLKASRATQTEEGQAAGTGLAKRAASSASHKARLQSNAQTTFLQMLHLAVYDNALQYSESEGDILLLHLLLYTLAKKLGVNSVRSSLPMMFTLQEDVFTIQSWTAKVAVASLVQGYFWSLADSFSFETSAEGRQIYSEIMRRQQNGLWLSGIKMPPMPLETIELAAGSVAISKAPSQAPANATFYRYENRQAIVESISDGYGDSLPSPANSPPTSPRAGPRRTFSTASALPRSNSSTIPQILQERRLPTRIREEMLSPWSKEAILSAAEKESARSNSVHTASGSSKRNNLLINGTFMTNNHSDIHLAAVAADPQLLTSRPHSATYPRHGGFTQPGPHLRHLQPGGTATPLSDSSSHSVLRVSDLKRVLSGTYMPAGGRHTESYVGTENEGFDSMASVSFNNSNTSLPLRDPNPNETTPRRGTTATTEQGDAAVDHEQTPIARRPSDVGLASANYAASNVSTQALSMHTAYTVIPPSESGSQAATPPANPTRNPLGSSPYAHYTTGDASNGTGAPIVTTAHLEQVAPTQQPGSSSLDPNVYTSYGGSTTSPAPPDEDLDIPPVPKLPESLKLSTPITSSTRPLTQIQTQTPTQTAFQSQSQPQSQTQTPTKVPQPRSTQPITGIDTYPQRTPETVRPRTAERLSLDRRPATVESARLGTPRFTPFAASFGAFGLDQPLEAPPRKRVDVSKLLSGLDEVADAAASRRAGVAAVGLGAPPY